MKLPPIHIKTVAAHALFWVLYIVSEYFANHMHMKSGDTWRFFRSTLLSLPVLMGATYFIALFAVPRFLKKERWVMFILWSVVVAVLVLYGRVWWLQLLNYARYGYTEIPVSKVLSNVIRDYAIIALAVCIYIIGDYRREHDTNLQLVKSKAEAEIKLLKGQLQPHFLFNSLNNIYSLALVQSEMAADSILKLTELLDYLVYRANLDKVPLAKEIQLLRNYIGLEQLRYEDHLRVETDFAVQNEDVLVAPLLLLPFAENCFKHGGTGPNGRFQVNIRLQADDSQLIFEITNTKKVVMENKSQTGGVGLPNIRQRLSLLYPGRHQLQIDDKPDLYRVRLEIGFRNEKV